MLINLEYGAVKKITGLNCSFRKAIAAVKNGIDYVWSSPCKNPNYKFGMRVCPGVMVSIFRGKKVEPVEKKYLGRNQDYNLPDGIYSYMAGWKIGSTGNKDMPDDRYVKVENDILSNISINEVLSFIGQLDKA